MHIFWMFVASIGGAMIALGSNLFLNIKSDTDPLIAKYIENDPELEIARAADIQCHGDCPTFECFHGASREVVGYTESGLEKYEKVSYVRVGENREGTRYKYKGRALETKKTCFISDDGKLRLIYDCPCTFGIPERMIENFSMKTRLPILTMAGFLIVIGTIFLLCAFKI